MEETTSDNCECPDVDNEDDSEDEECHPLMNSVVRKTSIKSFLDYINNLDDPNKIFFRNYKITLLTVDKSSDTTIKFWEKIGPSMNSLEMSWCRFKGVETVRNVMFKWTPNLQHFSLRDSTFYTNDEGSYTVENEVAEYDPCVPINHRMASLEFYGGESRVGPPLTWREVIVAYPNLQQLLLNNLSIHGINDILSEIGNIRRKDPSKLNIEKLNIFNGDFAFAQMTGPVAQLLMDLRLPITHLTLDVGMNTSDLIMASILKAYSKTLRHLTMYRGPFAIPFVMFPFEITFPELCSLELSETITDHLNFVLFMPKLQKLSVCESPDSEPPILPTDMVMNTDSVFKNSLPVRLTKFRLDYNCSLGDVRKLVRWFPEMKSLRMYLDNDSFRLICGEWKDLEELEILGDKVTDDGITGISFTSLHSSQIVVKKNPLSIRSLRFLRTFIMKNYGMSTSISDISVIHGFSLMPRLHHLELCSRLISDEGWKQLHAMPTITILKPYDGAWESQCGSFAKGLN